MVMKVSKSFCCCSLKAGTMVIGILGVIAGIGLLFDAPLGSDHVETLTELIKNNGTTVGNLTTELEQPEKTAEDHSFRVGHECIAGFIELVICGLLVVGTIKEKPTFVYPWIIVNLIILALSCVLYLILIMFVFVAGDATVGFLFAFIMFIYAGLHVYTILVVNSFYYSLTVGTVYNA